MSYHFSWFVLWWIKARRCMRARSGVGGSPYLFTCSKCLYKNGLFICYIWMLYFGCFMCCSTCMCANMSFAVLLYWNKELSVSILCHVYRSVQQNQFLSKAVSSQCRRVCVDGRISGDKQREWTEQQQATAFSSSSSSRVRWRTDTTS